MTHKPPLIGGGQGREPLYEHEMKEPRGRAMFAACLAIVFVGTFAAILSVIYAVYVLFIEGTP